MALVFPGAMELIIGTLRQQKMIAIPVYYWDGTKWVDFVTLTNPQMATWQQAWTGANEGIDATFTKVANHTISTRNDW